MPALLALRGNAISLVLVAPLGFMLSFLALRAVGELPQGMVGGCFWGLLSVVMCVGVVSLREGGGGPMHPPHPPLPHHPLVPALPLARPHHRL
ncbi:MAG: hypothetical protein R2865_00565 [Deinococcales bacterium]